MRQSPEVLFPHFTLKAPFFSELAVPLAAYMVSLGVVILLRVREFLFVIGLRLAGTQRFGDGQQDVYKRQTFPWVRN